MSAQQTDGRKCVTCRQEETLREVAGRLVASGQTAAVVVARDGRAQGIVSVMDILKAAEADLDGVRVAQVYTPQLVAVGSGDDLGTAAGRMLRAGVHQVPILAEGRPVGMVTGRDVVEAVAAWSDGAVARRFRLRGADMIGFGRVLAGAGALLSLTVVGAAWGLPTLALGAVLWAAGAAAVRGERRQVACPYCRQTAPVRHGQADFTCPSCAERVRVLYG